MKITKRQFEKIKHVFPKSRGSVQIDHFTMINILLYVVENGCKWRALPKKFGNWHTVYMRMHQWAENGVLFHLFETLRLELKINVDTSVLLLDSSCIKVHPDGTGALKNGKQSIGKTHGDRERPAANSHCRAVGYGPQKRSPHSRILLVLIHTTYYLIYTVQLLKINTSDRVDVVARSFER